MQEYYVEVGTTNYREFLFRKLSDLRSKEGLPIDIYEMKNGASYLVRCVYSSIKGKHEQDRLTARIYNYYFARALSDIIFQSWESGFVKKILKKEYSMNSNDIEAVLKKSWYDLNKEDQTYLPQTRRHALVKAILEFLDSHKRLDIEGFLNFRADLYKTELKKQIARAVNEYAIEQEHDGFVNLLKKFLRTQHTIYKTMHVVIRDQGEVVFYDDCGRNINDQCLEDNSAFLKDITNEKTPLKRESSVELYEDFLITAILKCAPRNIIVHANSEEHADMIKIIDEVFEEKISYCPGCSICKESI